MISVRSNWPVLRLVDAEIGRQFHRAAHARRHVDERAVGEHRRIERGEEIVADRHHRAEIFLHQFRMLVHASEIGMNSTPALASSALNVVATETESNTASTATRPSCCRCCPRRPPCLQARASPFGSVFWPLNAEQRFALAQRNAELFVGAQNFRIDLVERFRAVLLLRRRIVIEVLIVDRAVFDLGPFRLAHGQPALIGVEPPRQHPFRLVLLGRDEADRVLGQALGGLVRFDQRLEAILVLVDVDAPDLIDGLLYCRHSSLRSRFQGPRVGLSRLWSGVPASRSPYLWLQRLNRSNHRKIIQSCSQLGCDASCPLDNAVASFLQALRNLSTSVSVVFQAEADAHRAAQERRQKPPWPQGHGRAAPCPTSRPRPTRRQSLRDRRR